MSKAGNQASTSSSNGGSHLTPAFLAKARKTLKKEVEESSDQICKDREGLGFLATEKSADGDRESNEHHFLVGMEAKSGRLHEAVAALNRLNVGAYGICEECEGEISARRLEATGYKATLCVSCKEKTEEAEKHKKPQELGRY